MKMTDDVVCADSQWCGSGSWPGDVHMVGEEEEEEKIRLWDQLTQAMSRYLKYLSFRVDQSSVQIYPKFNFLQLYYTLLYCLVLLYPACDVRVNCAPIQGYKRLSPEAFLLKFGYLPQSGFEIRDRVSEATMIAAIEDLQRFGHINVTGVIDEDTRRLIAKPRCGVPDRLQGQFNSRHARHRAKRFTVQGQKWDDTDITWSLKKPSADRSIHEGDIRRELIAAFSIWARASEVLTFRELPSRSAENAHIQIVFEKRQHNDGYPFDGKGSILAHAFFPGSGQGGDVHFDDDEIWQVRGGDRESKGTRLFAVAAHEFGHSLGLSHSDVEGSLMFPWYQTFDERTPLPQDDKRGLEAIYGWKKSHKGVKPPSYKPAVKVPERPPQQPPKNPVYPTHDDKHGRPKTCDSSYDAISLVRGELFIFKGPYFWRFAKNELNMNRQEENENKFPSPIYSFWIGLPKNLTHVDAVYERGELIVFFIGRNYWVFKGNEKLRGPLPLTDLKIADTVDKIDGAMTWGHNDKTYIFSGSQYWRLDDTTNRDDFEVEPDYPRDMYVWKGVPYHIDSVFKWTDNHVYFFKGKVYWKFDDQHMQVASEIPSLSAPFWMGCTSEPIPRDNPRTGVTSTTSTSQTVHCQVLHSSSIFLLGALQLYFYSVKYC